MTLAPSPVMSAGRWWCAVISLPGAILVAGGYDGSGNLKATEALSLQTMYFAAGPTMLTGRAECAALALPQDHSLHRGLVMGGRGENPSLSTCTAVVLTATG